MGVGAPIRPAASQIFTQVYNLQVRFSHIQRVARELHFSQQVTLGSSSKSKGLIECVTQSQCSLFLCFEHLVKKTTVTDISVF